MSHNPKLNIGHIESLLKARPTAELEKQVAQEMNTPDRPLTVEELVNLSAQNEVPMLDMSPVEITEGDRRAREMELIQRMDQELS